MSLFKARIDEAEECIDGLNSKTATTEKLRNRYQVELEDLQVIKNYFSILLSQLSVTVIQTSHIVTEPILLNLLINDRLNSSESMGK